LAAIAGVAAVLAASCCVLPLALAVVGLGGGWLVILAPFVAHRGAILAIVAAVLTVAWLAVLWRCPCRRRRPALVVTAAASLAFVAAVTTPWWEAAAVDRLWALWAAGG
jgi:mercuric ion transport protein